MLKTKTTRKRTLKLKPDRREAVRQVLDQPVLAFLREQPGWVSAEEVSTALKLSRHIVAFSLRRVVTAGLADEAVIDVQRRTRPEQTRVYRARSAVGQIRRVETLLPGWLAPQAVVELGHARRVEGSASMRCWTRDDQSGKNGAPDGPEKGAASTSGAMSSATADDDAD